MTTAMLDEINEQPAVLSRTLDAQELGALCGLDVDAPRRLVKVGVTDAPVPA